MKIRFGLTSIVITSLFSGFVSHKIPADTAKNALTKREIVQMMEKVCTYQLNNLRDKTMMANGKIEDVPNNGWIRGVFYTGVMAAYETTKNSKFLENALDWADKNEWKLGPRVRHADDQVVAQTYIKLYELKKDSRMLEATQKALDEIIARPMPGKWVGWSKNNNWSWCDALYMAPPVYAMMSRVTGDDKYLRAMDKMWWETAEYLYDKKDSLYYRDDEYKPNPLKTEKREKNGKKVFWGRGNGWAIAGLTKVLDNMPSDYHNYKKFVEQYKEMAAKIKSLQGHDGLWRTSLYDPQSFSNGETSGSGFYCYALTWGVNKGILSRDEYQKVIQKAWKGLWNAVNDEGKLGWVQKVGHEPTIVHKDDTNEYAASAFLQAGQEIMKYVSSL